MVPQPSTPAVTPGLTENKASALSHPSSAQEAPTGLRGPSPGNGHASSALSEGCGAGTFPWLASASPASLCTGE